MASGWFDNRWQVQDSLLVAGDPETRAGCVLLHAPRPDLPIDEKTIEALVGRYELAPGVVVKVIRKGGGLAAQVNENPAVDLVPVSETEFFVVEESVQLVFVRDAAGKVSGLKGWQNGNGFSARRIE